MRDIPNPIRQDRDGWPWTGISRPTGNSPTSGTLISVIVPTLNHGAYIEETLRSILLQDHPAIELIVIDGGSTDQTPAILDHYSAFITHRVSEPDKGQTDAINKGLRAVTGDVLCYLNSDDLLMPGALSRVARYAAENPEVDLFYGTCVFIDENSNRTGSRTGNIFTLPEILDLWDKWWTKQNVVQPEVFWRASVTRKIGLMNTDLYFVMDYEYWLRILAAGGQFGRIDGELAAFRLLDNQKSADASGAANELLSVTGDWLWRDDLSISRLTRVKLQGDWLYNVYYLETVNQSVKMNETRLQRWKAILLLLTTKPKIFLGRSFWRRLRLLFQIDRSEV